jgi:hypothetical protein
MMLVVAVLLVAVPAALLVWMRTQTRSVAGHPTPSSTRETH